ncbi:UNVERIFIED_CONTAM: hypothetical protein Cloal_2541 [Acetivibrio alkalicellulosi]
MSYINKTKNPMKLKELSKETKKTSIEMSNIIAQVANAWTGKSASVFCDKLESLEKKISNISKDISLLGDVLSDEAKKR